MAELVVFDCQVMWPGAQIGGANLYCACVIGPRVDDGIAVDKEAYAVVDLRVELI